MVVNSVDRVMLHHSLMVVVLILICVFINAVAVVVYIRNHYLHDKTSSIVFFILLGIFVLLRFARLQSPFSFLLRFLPSLIWSFDLVIFLARCLQLALVNYDSILFDSFVTL
jgi:energy-coupling factor transporter transmembrane protein EcfT